MKPARQNQVIAELCGWSHHTNMWGTFWWHDEVNKTLPPGDDGFRKLPNYHGDLNACAEMEKTLDTNQLSEYADRLETVCVPVHICQITHWQAIAMATSAQRCEAFLRTHGKWEEV
jgi:hypothetical protein